jgi:hypothetical protein
MSDWLALALDAFLAEHRRCGGIEEEVTDTHVTAECGLLSRSTRSRKESYSARVQRLLAVHRR